MSAPYSALPSNLGVLSELELRELNRALRAGTVCLDWSAVTVAPPVALARLLDGLDLSRDADALGLEFISDDLEASVLAALQAQTTGSPRSRTQVGRRATVTTGPALWTAERQQTEEADVEVDVGGTEDGAVKGQTTEADHGEATMLAPPSPEDLRDEFQRLVLSDLLGPAGGPEEEVDERNVRERYLIGMLAPKGASFTGGEKIEIAGEDDDPTVAGEDDEQGAVDPGAIGPKWMFPSSFGLSCVVDGTCVVARATAAWGRYERVPSESAVADDGSPRLVWKRVPAGGSVEVPLAKGPVGPFVPDPEQPGVVITGTVRRRDRDWIASFFLVNEQEEPRQSKDKAWLFQPELMLEGMDGGAVFAHRAAAQSARNGPAEPEAARMAMLYRRQLEFGVGHGVGVRAEVDPSDPTRAFRIRTAVAPVHEVPATDVPTAADVPELGDLVLDMKKLAELSAEELGEALAPLPAAYAVWLDRERARVERDPDLQAHVDAARHALADADRALARVRAGIELVGTDPLAADAFRFMNRAMGLQRVRTIYAERRRRGAETTVDDLDKPENRSWRPFQLAFILLNLPGLTRLDHTDRATGAEATADLLWFPTGGGKTEAYLGLTAYTLAIRRLQGIVAGRSGEYGVAVLMRYTLRLLTLQQFQRAATLICACEVLRREAIAGGDDRWGAEPFRVGLWVGMRMTPTRTEQSTEILRQARGQFRQGGLGGRGSPAQLPHCPWCGTAIDPGRNIRVESFNQGRGRTLTFCGDLLGRCPFSARGAPGEGLPVVVVDEEIYRLLPSLLIATVDKFAQLPWKGETQMLFGQVSGRCERHGFRSPDLEDSDRHPARGALPSARTHVVPLPRPPDLIIQDELHLISGPLGTLAGLYETAIDELASWDVDVRRVRPKLVASTATIRRAGDQIHALFLRRVEVFPPQGIDVEDSFFAIQRPTSVRPGRRYLGICAKGKRLKALLIRVYVAHLAAAQTLYEKYGAAADPYMTLVGYFGSMRELGGMRRLVDDDVRSRLRHAPERGLAKRNPPVVEELTSRLASTEIPRVLDRLKIPFDPTAEAESKATRKRPPRPIDVLLATNMVSVGVDVRRLGLMVVAGQPKTTAEYIQATSRVGRASPGFVCVVFNWTRPRDLSHYERFEHYHATFYQQVEALSVTPFAPPCDRPRVDRPPGFPRPVARPGIQCERAGGVSHGRPSLSPSLS